MAGRLALSRISTRQYGTDMSFVPGYHNHATPQTEKFWKRMTFFVALPAVALAMVNSYLLTKEEHENYVRPPYVQYEYMGIRTKRFPWGDGTRTLFHNPHRNPIPGVGYEADPE